MTIETNPYAAPDSPVQEAVAPASAPELWNPNAAALWSLLFSPVFGAYLQMRNWQSLGEPAKAQTSWYWMLASIAVIVGVVVASMVLPEAHWFQKASNRSGFILLLAWYFAHGKLQLAYVKERYGKAYPRKGWGIPLAVAIAAIIALVVAAMILTFGLMMAGVVEIPQ